MSMSFWVIVSWVFVLILTAVNVGIFLKLKQASEQMLKMAFPNAKNMGEALQGMQQMMSGIQGMQGGRGGNPFAAMGGAKNSDAQLKAAMDMLARSQKKR